MGGPAAALVCRRTIAVDHPAFAGHFPGRPILPGVVLLAEVLEALRAAGQLGECGITINAAKFLAPVGPGALLDIHVEPGEASRRFEVRQGTQPVASGVLALA